jgi:iron complex outermembrane recepter protein
MKSQRSVVRRLQPTNALGSRGPGHLAYRPQPIAWAVSILLMGFAGQGLAQQVAAAKADETQTIEVTGIRGSLLKSIISKRNAPTNVEVITAEDVGKMPDKNIADALSRLPGVNVQYGGALAMDEAERVAIRGTSPNLNLITINGHALSSGDWHVGDQAGSGRSVGFGLMPSQLIGRTVVYKTTQADITEGGIAGTIDVQTRKPLDLGKSLVGEVSLGAVYADLPRKTDPQISGLLGWKNESGTLGVIVQAFSEKRHLRRDGMETFGFNTISAATALSASGGGTAAAPVNAALRDQLVGKRLPGSLNSALFEGVRERTGGYLGVQFKPTQDIDLNLSAFRSELKADNYNSSGYILPNALITNGWLLSNAKFEGDVLTSATLTRPAPSAANANQRVIGFQFDHFQRQGAVSLSSFYDLEGKINVTRDLTINARGGYTEGSGKTNSQPSIVFGVINPNVSYQSNSTRPTDYNITNAITGAPVDLRSVTSFGQMSNVGASVNSTDKENYFHLDATYKKDFGMFSLLKFGARVANHKRGYEVINPRYNAQDDANGVPLTASPFLSVTGGTLVNFQNLPVYPGTTPPTATPVVPNGSVPLPATSYPGNYASGIDANFPRDLFRYDPSQITAFTNQYVNWNSTLNANYVAGYTVKEGNKAIYAMGEFEKDALSGNVGVRFARTTVNSTSYQNLNPAPCPTLLAPCTNFPGAITSSRVGVFLPQVVQTKHDVVLPSVNLRYEIDKDLLVRAALGRSLGRPNYNELAGAVSLNNTTGLGTSGNPRLQPITATNFDLGLAWYFKPRAYASIGLFQSDLSNYVKAGASQVDFFNTAEQKITTFTVQSRIGVAAKISGLEAALELPIGAGFGVGTNATFADGKDRDGVEVLGTSARTYNITGWFENDAFSARMGWNYRSDYAIGYTGDGTYNVSAPGVTPNGVHMYKSSGSLSVSLNYKVTKNLSVTFDGNNLLNPVRSTYYKNYTGLSNAPGYWHEFGRQYFVNLRAQF